MYCKQTELQRIFSIGSTHTSKVCRMIEKHEDRYKGYPVIGKRYSLVAFADAYKYYNELEEGKDIPEFDSTKAGYLLLVRGDIDWQHFKDDGVKEERKRIKDEIMQWFKDTKPPAKTTPKHLMGIICEAMLAITSGEEP